LVLLNKREVVHAELLELLVADLKTVKQFARYLGFIFGSELLYVPFNGAQVGQVSEFQVQFIHGHQVFDSEVCGEVQLEFGEQEVAHVNARDLEGLLVIVASGFSRPEVCLNVADEGNLGFVEAQTDSLLERPLYSPPLVRNEAEAKCGWIVVNVLAAQVGML